MAIDVRINGTSGSSQTMVQIDPTYQSMRANLRPSEYQPAISSPMGGHYRIGAITGTMAASIASGAQVFQLRWADPTKLFILQRLMVQCCTGTGFAATTLGCPLELIVGHSSTANGTGGTVLSLNSISNRMRSSMSPSSFVNYGEIRVASTVALSAATGQVLEAQPLGGCMGAPNATLAQSSQMTIFEMMDAGDHPLILMSGDTLVVRTNSPAATGTWFAYFTMEWFETVSF